MVLVMTEVVMIVVLLFFRANKQKADWLVMSSVFVASQSSCFFLCVRTNSPSGKQALLNVFESDLARTKIEFLTQILT